MYIQRNQAASELLDRLLRTAMHIRSLAETGEATDPRRAQSALEGIRQRMSSDVEAIDEYLKKLSSRDEA